jgi:tRNA dimethylallyltransferase
MASSSPPARAHNVLALFGPTASGKTAVAGLLRERLGAEVISADSAALYQGLPVITAVPDYPARLVGVVPLSEDVTVGEYQRLAHAAIDESDAPLVVGGTGLYFRAALSGLELPPPAPAERRGFWQGEYDRLGPDGAHAVLAERDPAAAERVHANDRKRVVRALELTEAGHSLAPDENRLWTDDTRLPTTIVALDVPLDELDRRIAERTRAMAAAGAARVGRAALRDRTQGPRPGAVRDAVRGRSRHGRHRGHAAARALPAQVAPPHPRRGYGRQQPGSVGGRR